MKKFLAVLLICTLGVATGLLSISHMNLCIGSDGHIDISSCLESVNAPESNLNASKSKEHHDECLDIEITCEVFDNGKLALVDASSLNPNSKKNDISLMLPMTFSLLSNYEDRSRFASFPVNAGTLSSSHPVFLCTTVLLI